MGMERVVLPRPSSQEMLKLHRELQLWMMHTRYQLQGFDHRPVWRMHNTSLVLGTGAGVGTYCAMRSFFPKMKFPFNVVPPVAMFLVTQKAAQVAQLPHLIDSLLQLPTPLGGKSREVLVAIREGGRLPSQEFANPHQAPLHLARPCRLHWMRAAPRKAILQLSLIFPRYQPHHLPSQQMDGLSMVSTTANQAELHKLGRQSHGQMARLQQQLQESPARRGKRSAHVTHPLPISA